MNLFTTTIRLAGLVVCFSLCKAQLSTPSLATANSEWPAVQDTIELSTVRTAADYIVGLLNLRNVFSEATILERVIMKVMKRMRVK